MDAAPSSCSKVAEACTKAAVSAACPALCGSCSKAAFVPVLSFGPLILALLTAEEHHDLVPIIWPGGSTVSPSDLLNECNLGEFIEGSACSSCSPGMYNDRRTQTACRQCTPGSYSAEKSSVRCKPCMAGMLAQNFGMKKCLKCNVSKSLQCS